MDKWLSRARRKDYNCANLASEVLECPLDSLTGAVGTRTDWQRLSAPQAPCLAVLRRNSAPPHVGIYLQGGVLHLSDKTALFQPLHVIQRDYNKIRYYARRNNNN